MNAAADLWKRVRFGSAEECWPFEGALTTKGYGQFFFDGRRHTAHRVAYELARGPIADEMVVDHLCRRRACCNPNHLEVVTSRENTLRGEGIGARRASATHCGRGHEFTPENTYRQGPGLRHRKCRTCHLDSKATPKPPAPAGPGTATAAPHPFTAPSN